MTVEISARNLETRADCLLNHSIGGIVTEDVAMIKGDRIAWLPASASQGRIYAAGAIANVCLAPSGYREQVGETCDMIRVMCYEMYWAPGRGDPKLVDRPDTQGIGPTSSYDWARAAMKFWLDRAPREKLIMGLRAYSNDYALSLKGRGKQVYASSPQVAAGTPLQKAWLWYERLPVYLYADTDGTPHLFYASNAESTKAHLETVDDLDLPGIGFWHFSSVGEATWNVVREWLNRK